jgi:guanidinopropionase
MKEPRFAEIATFMRAPLAQSLEDLDIALIGVPTDLGVTNRPGARHGPREIRNASSLMRIFNVATNVNPYELARIADVGDVQMPSRYDLEAQIAEIAAFYRHVVEAGVLPLSAGGDHSITYPIFQALGAKQPVGMVHVDAHCDTWGEFSGSKYHHGAPFRLAVEEGLLDPRRTIQIGIRGGQNLSATARRIFHSTSMAWIPSTHPAQARRKSAASRHWTRSACCADSAAST